MESFKKKEAVLVMFSKFSALEGVSAEEGEGGAGFMVPTGDALHLQLKVQLQRFSGCQVRQRGVPPKRGGQEVVGLSAFVL